MLAGPSHSGRDHEQRSQARAAKRAGEAAAVEVDRLQHLTTLANAHAAPVGNVRVPDGAVGVEADAVGDAVAEVGPHPPVGQAAVSGDC